jgi:lipoate-protein ligase A
MKLLDLTLTSPAENLACDEALLDSCEAGAADEILRFWEPREYFVVVGYSNKVATEVNVAACEARDVPILRRCSGGGTVLQGPGCLNYALLLRIEASDPLHSISAANRFIMERNRAALESRLQRQVTVEGHTDLALGGLKFSGNSQRRRRRFLLFHGTFLLDLDIARLEALLPPPSKQPDYRRHRSHADFLANLHVPVGAIKTVLAQTWEANCLLAETPRAQIETLTREKYSTRDWSLKF